MARSAERWGGAHLSLDKLPAMVWEADARTLRISFMSERAQVLLGHPLACWFSDADLFARSIHHADREQVLDLCRAVASDGIERSCDHRALAADGRELWLLTYVHALASGAAGVESLCGLSLDITERKRGEDTLRMLRARAEELVAIVAHDLKNPLGAIGMNADALVKMLPEGAWGQRLRRPAQAIQRSTDRMSRLIHGLLDLNSIELGHLHLAREACDPLSLLQQAADLIEPQAAERSLLLSRQCETENVEVLCDRERALQVLSNLLGNAIKFTPEGGAIAVRARIVGHEVLFQVEDTGRGIAPSELPFVFDRYFRAKGVRQGTGLGLSIAKGIVEAHGGRIWVASRLGDGTSVFFTLPLWDRACAEGPWSSSTRSGLFDET